MDDGSSKKPPPRHFAVMHGRIQMKYEELQRKLEKSKSMDAVNLISDKNDIKYYSFNSVENVSDIGSEIQRPQLSPISKQNVIIEELQVQNCNVDDVENFSGDGKLSVFKEIINDDFGNISSTYPSTESLCEEITNKESQPKPPPRVRIREKIAAVRDKKRKKKEEEKKERELKKKDSPEKVEKLILSNTTTDEVNRLTKRIRTATASIALISAKDLCINSNEEKINALYCKFRLGNDKYKSKVIKCDNEEVSWLELFNLTLYDEFMLEISLWNKDKQEVNIGRKVFDLSEIETENTYRMKLQLENEGNKSELFFLLTISGTYHLNTVADSDGYNVTQDKMNSLKNKYAWYQLAEDYSDVGYLSVLVYGAKGISANDAYCVLELENHRRQTHTEYKTCEPNWMKVFNFTVTDITSILELSVCDESKKSEIVGRISVPLLRIENGKKKWYALKDKAQREIAKGNSPRILLEMRVTWQPVKASVRVINPKEAKYLQTPTKLDRRIFARNVARCKAVLSWIFDALRVMKTCFEWESRKRSFVALIIWLLFCWFFEPWMLPMLILIPFIWYRPTEFRFKGEKYLYRKHEIETRELDIETKTDKEEKKSLMERFNNLQDLTQTVQNAIGRAASIGESIKNLVNFTVPFLSFLSIFILLTISFIMYLIPIKYIFMAWGINKFTRKIRRPNRIPNNEVLDLLTRVPDDETLLDCEEISLDVEEVT